MTESTPTGTERVWDAFLTERDKALLARHWGKSEPMGLGTRPVVLVIDNYLSALGDGPMPLLESVKRWPMSCGEEGWAAVERTKPLLEVARREGVPVVFTRNDPDGPSLLLPDSRTHVGMSDEQRARRFDIVDELKPQPEDVVIVKSSYSAFFATPLVSYLTLWHADTILLCGNSTSGCIRATAVDGAQYRYRVGVVEDCCFDRTQATHAINLFDIDHKYGDVMHSSQVRAYLEGLPGD